VKTIKFGHFGPEPGIGANENWYHFIEEVYLSRLEIIKQSGTWDVHLCQRVSDIFSKHKNYLATFDKPTLVHADMNTSNVFLHQEDGKWRISGIIDFADSFSGDPLFDLGGLLLEINIQTELKPKWSDISDILVGYGPLLAGQEEIIKLYTLCLVIFYLCEDNEVRKKKGLNFIPTKYTQCWK